ncbi:MAG: DUF1552 domain-containing protein [Saccharospirillaceae bacterium]|nr:DUF1552 domain-containing protein [Pseudomonadales bacterium]NRB78759.1 DUF1552 domain-containing protein [Saccharospirillaceae bacterium]
MYIDNPRLAYTRLFGDIAGEESESDGMLKEPYSHNLAELAALKSKLGPQAIARIEEHEAAIKRAILNLEQQVDVGCDNQVQSTYGWENTGSKPEVGHFTQVSNQHCDTIALALKCGLTNLVTLSLGTSDVDFTVPEFAELGPYHTVINSNTPHYIKFRNYLSERLAYLINVLKTTTDENGDSLLDSTIVLQVTCMGDGSAHDQANAPFTMATATKNMIGGRGVTVSHSHSLLDTVTAALGVEDQMPQYGDGAVPSLLL